MNDCFLYDYIYINYDFKDNVKQVDVIFFINVVLIECLFKYCLFEIDLKCLYNLINLKLEFFLYEYDLMILYL